MEVFVSANLVYAFNDMTSLDIKQTRVVFWSALLMALAAFTYAQQPAVSPAPTPVQIDPAFTVPPYLQDLRSEQVTVLWWSVLGAYGWVEYGETEALGMRADTVFDGLRATGAWRHAVRLTGLKPGTRYWYRTGLRAPTKYTKNWIAFTPDAYSPVYTFTTPSPNDSRIRCVFLNDMQSDTNGVASLLALPGVKPFDFSFFNGDSFAGSPVGSEMQAALRAYSAAADGASRPAVFLRGNQELGPAFQRRDLYPYATNLRSLIATPEGRSSYAFTQGPVRFVILDCGGDKPDDDPSYGGMTEFSGYRAEVREWLAREIVSEAFRKARWHVLVHHLPLYGPAASKEARAAYLPVLEKAVFDLALNGYMRQPAVLKRGTWRNPYPVVFGGGAGPAATLTVFEATAANWTVKVMSKTGQVLFEERAR